MLKFKTNARCAGCSAAIRKALGNIAPESSWNIDLESPDRILTYNGSDPVSADEVMKAVAAAGFKIEPIA